MNKKYNFIDKLDYLMEHQQLNRNILSGKSGIPYTTIDNWYKRGYEGLKLTTLKKLSNALNVDIDYWIDDDILDPNESQNAGYGKYNPKYIQSEKTQAIISKRVSKLLRDEPGIAKALGITDKDLKAFIDGTKVPNLDIIMRIANYYTVSVDYLVGTENKKKSPAPDEESETRADLLIDLFYTLLVEGGYVRDGDELTSRQMDYVVAILNFVDLSFGDEQGSIAAG